MFFAFILAWDHCFTLHKRMLHILNGTIMYSATRNMSNQFTNMLAFMAEKKTMVFFAGYFSRVFLTYAGKFYRAKNILVWFQSSTWSYWLRAGNLKYLILILCRCMWKFEWLRMKPTPCSHSFSVPLCFGISVWDSLLWQVLSISCAYIQYKRRLISNHHCLKSHTTNSSFQNKGHVT